jgi:hypothetical protein
MRLIISRYAFSCLALLSLVFALNASVYAQDEDRCAAPTNPIVAENCQPGTESWIVTTYRGDIEGYAYPATVNLGESVDFFVSTSAARFTLDVYRTGYYGGAGGRLMTSIPDVAAISQPACNSDTETGLVSCGNWSSNHTLTIPDDWVSGVYFVKITRPDTGGENYMHFVVRDDERDSAILVQQSLFTFYAYNGYGGKSVYDFNSGFCNTISGSPRGVKVSAFRPHVANAWSYDGFNDQYIHVEYPFVRWLEEQGYDITYSTNMDTHRSGLPDGHNELLDHKIFLSIGHDEYWTQEMREAVTAARDAGIHLGIFSSNTGYWRVRLEEDPWTGAPDSVMVTYKSIQDGIPDPSGHDTTTFRDRATINNPEASLFGIQYIGDNDTFYFPLRVTAEQGKHELYRHTDLQNMPPDTYINLSKDIYGWEWDAVFEGVSPDNIEILAESPIYGFLLQDDGNHRNGTMGTSVANATRYVAPSGAIVFAAGTNQWGWGFGTKHLTPVQTDLYIVQLVYNLFADMGVQPATPSDALILDGEDGIISSPPEAFLPITSDVPIISNVQIDLAGNLIRSGRSFTVTWTTDVPATGQIFLGTEAGHIIFPRDSHADYVTDHSIAVVGQLYPNTTYYYKVASIDERGQIAISDEGSFTLPPNLLADVGVRSWDAARAWRCLPQQNPGALAFFALVGVAGLVFLVGFVMLVRRWWRSRRARASQ